MKWTSDVRGSSYAAEHLISSCKRLWSVKRTGTHCSVILRAMCEVQFGNGECWRNCGKICRSQDRKNTMDSRSPGTAESFWDICDWWMGRPGKFLNCKVLWIWSDWQLALQLLTFPLRLSYSRLTNWVCGKSRIRVEARLQLIPLPMSQNFWLKSILQEM